MLSILSVISDLFDDVLVKLPIVCYNDYYSICRPTNNLIYAVLAGNCTCACYLSILGFAVLAANL